MNNQKTKRKLNHNQRFIHNDHEIKKVIFWLNRKYRGRITARQIAKATGLTRQAVYNHCSSMKSAVADSEQSILADFSDELDLQVNTLRSVIPDTNVRLFYATLVFMARRPELFCSICADVNNQGLLYQMMEMIFPRLGIIWLPKGLPAPAPGSERADLLIRMLVGVLSKWGASTNCDIRKANRCIRRLLRATEDAAANRLP